MPNQLPTNLGEVLYTDAGVTLHHPEARKFDPVEHYSFPAAEQVKEQTHKAPHEFERPHPPIFLGDLPFAPIAYVVHRHSTECENCAALHYHSVVYAWNRLRNRSGTGYVENLSPVSSFAYNVPIDIIDVKPAKTPICFECAATVSLDQLPIPPEPNRIVGFSGSSSSPSPTKAKPAARVAKTIDDLL